MMGGRMSLIPHQLYIIHEVANRYAPRVLLADEVGLGKTIEAGGIIHQQLYTGKVQRVLIVVPESLMHQWLVEMRRKFNLNFSLFDAQRCLDEEMSGLVENPFDSSQLVICTLDFLLADPSRYQQCLTTDWDLLVVDEAHHLQWTQASISPEYHCIEQLSQKIQGVLLLTATPEQLGKESHFARLRLLDPDRYQDYQIFLREEKDYQPLVGLIDSLHKLQLEESELAIKFQLTESEWQALEKEVSDVAQLNELKSIQAYGEQANSIINNLIHQLLDYHGTGRVLFRNSRSSIQGFPKRQPISFPLKLPAQYLSTEIYPERSFQEQNEHSGHSSPKNKPTASWASFDSRVTFLLNLLKQYPTEKIVLITANAKTAQELHLYLKHKENKVTAVFHEGLSLFERDRAAAFFADKDSICQCLICSEIGSEGRNFQFSSHLVLFDLPLNPDLLEQRIGRLDRIGQKRDIKIHIPYFKKSAQELLYRWNNEGLNSLSHSCTAAYQVFSILENDLVDLLAKPIEQHIAEQFVAANALLSQTQKLTKKYNQQLEQGRDRLLEYNSCRHEISKVLMKKLINNEKTEQLKNYLEHAFDCFGLENEEHKEKSYILHESNEMQQSFTQIGDDGLTYTLDRDTALSNEDILFLTWEHPLVSELMEKLISDDMGSTSMVTFSDPSIEAGQLFLEALYIIDIPSGLENEVSVISQSHSQTILVDISGKEVNSICFELISKTVVNLDKQTIKGVIDAYATELRGMQKSLEKLMKLKLRTLIDDIISNNLNKIDQEIIRLEALKKINPMVRDVEIESFKQKKIILLSQSQTTRTHLDALRVLISV